MATGVAIGRPIASEAGGITHLDSLATATQGTVELQVYVHANHPFDEVKPLFEAAHPDIKLKMLEQNDMAALRATLAANGEGAPDIFWPEINDVQILGASRALLEVTDLVDEHREDLVPGKVAECYIPSTSEYAAFPGDIATVGLYYRADLWEQSGVSIPDDWSWEEFLAAAATVKEQTGAFSLFFPPDDGSGSAVLLFDFVLCQLGGAYTNADGTEVTMDDEKGVAALTLVKAMYEADVHIEDSPTNETFFAALAGNQIATLPMPVWYRGYGIEPNVTEGSDGYGQWRVALLPTPTPEAVRTANYGGAAIASTKYTKHPEQVKAFMKFALGSMEGAAACDERAFYRRISHASKARHGPMPAARCSGTSRTTKYGRPPSLNIQAPGISSQCSVKRGSRSRPNCIQFFKTTSMSRNGLRLSATESENSTSDISNNRHWQRAPVGGGPSIFRRTVPPNNLGGSARIHPGTSLCQLPFRPRADLAPLLTGPSYAGVSL